MRDSDVVAAIVAGDHGALGEAYDRYAPGLHSYCQSLMDQPADAVGVVRDTFVIAASRLSGLRESDRLRSWLYAVARNECHHRLRAGAGRPPVEETQEVPGEGAERPELRALVDAALGGVSQSHREILVLHLRQGLGPGEIADVLGVSRKHAHALLSRGREQLEMSLGVLLVARTGRGDCQELDAMLRGWDGRPTALPHRQIARHLEHCAVCGVRKHRELKPAAREAAAIPLAAAALPTGLRGETIDAATSGDPAGVLHRVATVERAGRFSQGGWPRRRAPQWWHRHRVPVGAAGTAVGAGAVAAAVLAGGAPTLFVVPHGPSAVLPVPGTYGHVRPGTPPGRTDGGGPGNGAPGASGGPGASGAPGATSGTATDAGRPPGTSPAASGLLHSPTPTGQASTGAAHVSQGTVSVSPSTLALTPLTGSAFTITAHAGPVSWSVSPAASLIGTVTASPASGTLAAGQSVTVTVTAASILTVASDLTVNPGGHLVTVLAGL